MTIRGPAFYKIGNNSSVSILSGETKLAENVRMMLLTPKGTRVNFPEYGSLLNRLPFTLMDSSFDDLCYYYINQAITDCMPELTLKTIDIKKDIDSKVVYINIIYMVSSD